MDAHATIISLYYTNRFQARISPAPYDMTWADDMTHMRLPAFCRALYFSVK